MQKPDEIAQFYDAHPYPPPIEDLERSMIGWSGEAARRVEHFRHWPTLPYREDLSILVAGCGTSQAVRWAARNPEARVVGIDVSPTSLEAERTLADRYRLHNLELLELAIEDVRTLGSEFDQIVCTGVLHHLIDPGAGLRALRDISTREGAIQIMVYAGYGRFGVSMLREYCRRLGVESTTADVNLLMRVLKELPQGHPMSHVLRTSADFGDADAIADALLNPRERSYTVPELFDLLDEGGVRFGRWVRQAPYRPQCGIMRDLSHGSHLAEMADVDQFSAMELFRGTIVRHSLIAYRDDSSIPPLPISWDVEVWGGYVPMVPETVVVVEERLPPGMAAAVINRAHVDRDLVCFLTREELEVFRLIDGERTTGEIPGSTLEIMKLLWMHDLVMIDASGA